VLKAAARHNVTHQLLYQPLRLPWTWRLPNTYGWLAKYPIDAKVMRGYVRPVLTRPEIRFDGRKAIGAVDARFVRAAADQLRSFDGPMLCAWAAEDHVFPLDRARNYASLLGADLRTIEASYTYTAEDQPARRRCCGTGSPNGGTRSDSRRARRPGRRSTTRS
jgi:pimeloyl-ACP methyl ester carboxylesterase